MTQLGTGVRVALTVGILQLASCSSTAATNRVDDLQKDGGGAASGSGGSGGGGGSTGNGGQMVHGGLVRCGINRRSCSYGVVYEVKPDNLFGPGFPCEHPVSTCPYGCNPEWKSEDLQSPICTAPPPGCDDAGNCPDAGNQPGSEPPDAGDAARD